ncbi:hypothetical protein RQN9TF_12650 [Rhodococcus qingshengii]|uniref:hypothetical protein n=1 Tax=Rhodococcus TaxID=1827 RepID=UPI000F61C6BB|nr:MULTISPECIES: hypothetical protein [Rhodococcus]AZI61846.1 hypothetical protein EHW12_12210 [Rhodococcus sp. NJ-530]BDQ20054.1 hypothetical protein RQN9TF_12650 [Rhodococcus qingshengii]
MSDTTRKDDELRMEIIRKTSTRMSLSDVDIVMQIVKQYGLQERIDGLDMVSWRYGIFRDTTLGKPVDTKAVSLKDIAKYKAELTALKTKQEVAN